MPRRPIAPVPAGTLCVIGGAEDRTGHGAVLRRFVELCASDAPRIAVIATASQLGEEIFDAYDAALRTAGAAETVPLRPMTRGEADDPATCAALDGVDGIFLTGGNQLILTSVVVGTHLADAIAAAYRRGAVVGGTSAGASAVTEHMVAFGDQGDSPRQGLAGLSAGLGLLPGAIVDQHFAQRSRYSRLLSLVARAPHLLGIGVDEDTAAVIHGERVLEVAGTGCVFVVDGANIVTDVPLAEHGAPLLVSGAVVHTLPSGSQFDLWDRHLLSFQETRPARSSHEPEEDA